MAVCHEEAHGGLCLSVQAALQVRSEAGAGGGGVSGVSLSSGTPQTPSATGCRGGDGDVIV